MAEVAAGTDRADDTVDGAEKAIARRIGFVARPVRGLVNAPHLLVLVVLAIWVAC